MSRIGKLPVTIPGKVKVELDGVAMTVTGPKGTLSRKLHPEMIITVGEQVITVTRPSESRTHRALHGLTRQLVFNMVEGVSNGFTKTLVIIGVGYRAELVGSMLKLALGFSHPVMVKPPEGITFELPEAGKVRISGIDKELVGQVAAKVRSFRPPEPYKGKGVRYEGEYVRRKAGKTAA
ncbi:MAG: 50S ribosomal protein L6 [bacterium]